LPFFLTLIQMGYDEMSRFLLFFVNLVIRTKKPR
jgi:hypothetical protein